MGSRCFNTPGANANAVKELVISSMLLASRNICQAGVMLMIFHLTILKLQLKMVKNSTLDLNCQEKL